MQLNKIPIPFLEGLLFVNPERILHCESSGNYTTIYFTDGTNTLACRTLKEFEERLSQFGFFRTHQSHLINLQYIHKYLRGGMIILSDKSVVRISNAKRKEFMRLIST